ncbi:MAG: esterase [Anaerolineae bacterium]|nr:esterase [Anaerolineae bacterium]
MTAESQVIIETITSDVLRDNPLGDPFVRRMPVYLPPGYEDGDTRYPTVYLLTGFTGRGTLMINDSAFDESIQERLDRLINAGTIQPMIVVLPDGFTRYGGSQYLNSSATGQYEDHLVKEVVPHIDTNYRTKAEAGFRAIGGKSSGGYGSLVQGMRHPDVFGAIACHSGDMYFDYCYKPEFPKFLDAAARNNIDSYESLRDFLDAFTPKMYPKPPAFFDILHMSAMSACYSPNPDSPSGFDLPFTFHTGEFRPDVWQRWLAWDPITLLVETQYAEALRHMKLIYLDCGNRDEYALHYGARILSQRLTELDIHHHHQEFDGGHRSTNFRYDVSLEAISQAFAE